MRPANKRPAVPRNHPLARFGSSVSCRLVAPRPLFVGRDPVVRTEGFVELVVDTEDDVVVEEEWAEV